MIVAPIGVGLELDHEVHFPLQEAFGIGQRRGAVEAVVGDQKANAGGLTIRLHPLLDLHAKGDVALEICEAEHEGFAVARLGDRGSCLHHRAEILRAQHGAVEGGRIEPVEIIREGRGWHERPGEQHRQWSADHEATPSHTRHIFLPRMTVLPFWPDQLYLWTSQ
jgi:hypothetical protein